MSHVKYGVFVALVWLHYSIIIILLKETAIIHSADKYIYIVNNYKENAYFFSHLAQWVANANMIINAPN